jgi:hypothetical protein
LRNPGLPTKSANSTVLLSRDCRTKLSVLAATL